MRWLLLAGLAVMGSGCRVPAEPDESASEEKAAVQHVAAGEAAALLGDGETRPVILDIRTPEEFAAGHLEGARNIDFRSPDFRKNLEALDRGTPYLIHCRSGGRSTASLETFGELGFTVVYHLDGGFVAWEEAGNPVEKP